MCDRVFEETYAKLMEKWGPGIEEKKAQTRVIESRIVEQKKLLARLQKEREAQKIEEAEADANLQLMTQLAASVAPKELPLDKTQASVCCPAEKSATGSRMLEKTASKEPAGKKTTASITRVWAFFSSMPGPHFSMSLA